MATTDDQQLDFVRNIIRADLDAGKHKTVVTRFPPEPNGFLHIGHAKAICLSFGIATEFGGRCWLRFDDTNPLKEEDLYVAAIQQDLKWLGFDWGERLSFASDYFERLYKVAESLIEQGLAYVDSQSQAAIRQQRGTLTLPGQNSRHRTRSAAENLELFRGMRLGDFGEAEHVLRAKINMANGNLNMRDPVLYRILHASHHRTGDSWCVYPMYDYTHSLCDAFEGITHSLCSLEFADHRPLYDWVLAAARTAHRPQQIEFSRLQLEHSVLSKRRLNLLVKDALVSGWDDPRMPTLAGLRKRGVPPAAIVDFCGRIGVTKKEHVIEMASFEHNVRATLERRVRRGFALLHPLKLIIDNLSATAPTMLEAAWHPNKPELGTRQIQFGSELYIEQHDFSLDPPKGYKRLTPGVDVRLRYGYILRCGEPELDAAGRVTAVHCTFYENSRSGQDTSGIRAKGVIHWLAASSAVPIRVNLYDVLFSMSNPNQADDISAAVNPDSLTICDTALAEPAVATVAKGRSLQFERIGYFIRDAEDTPDARPVFNRTIKLRNGRLKQGRG